MDTPAELHPKTLHFGPLTMPSPRKCVYLALMALLFSVLPACFLMAKTAPEVWFGPAPYSPDIGTLFSEPQRWAYTRALIDGIAFSPGQLEGHPNLLARLKSADAFKKPALWKLATILGVPALKEWDCAARVTSKVSAGLLQALIANGGTAQFLEMDEPLVSALGINVPVCKLSINQAAREVASYVHSVTTDRVIAANGSTPRIVDIEAYPALSVEQIETWLQALQKYGFKPDGLNIDPNIDFINLHAELRAHLTGDLRELQRFLQQQRIPFGVIIWSGHDPEQSDEDYYRRAMSWMHTVHDAIGSPDRLIFESWVKRCSTVSACIGAKLGCLDSEPRDCGKMSVPVNLPETEGSFSHTRLIIDGIKVFAGH